MGIEFIGTQIFMSMTQVISSGGQEKIPSRKDTSVGSHGNFLFVPPGLKPFSGLDRSRQFYWHPGEDADGAWPLRQRGSLTSWALPLFSSCRVLPRWLVLARSFSDNDCGMLQMSFWVLSEKYLRILKE